MHLPPVESAAGWEAAREALLVKQQHATRAGAVLVAERRRLPMVWGKAYRLQGPNGQARLVDLFHRRRQLVVYHCMFAPAADGWPDAGCDGCSLLADNLGHLAHLHARDTSCVLSCVLVSWAPLGNLQRYRERMGWTIPWLSSAGSDVNVDFGLTSDAGATFGLRVFVRDDENVVRPYCTNPRGTKPRPGQHLGVAGPHAARPAGAVGELAGGLPQPALSLVAPPRRVRRRHDRAGAVMGERGGYQPDIPVHPCWIATMEKANVQGDL